MEVGTTRLSLGALLGVIALLLFAAPTPAQAIGFTSFSFSPSPTQAGGHPDLSIDVGVEASEPTGAARRLTVNWPVGLSVYAGPVTWCSATDLAEYECPVSSQLGVATILEAGDEEDVVLGTVPVFSVQSTPDTLARVGLMIPVVKLPVYGDLTLRSGSDYGMRLELGEFPQSAPLAALELELWGVPAAVNHDAARFPEGSEGCVGEPDTSCNTMPVPSSLPPRPLTESPTRCVSPLLASAELETHSQELFYEELAYPQATGCDQLSFDPSITASLSTTEVRSPTGLDVDFSVPQFPDPSTPSPSEPRLAHLHFEDGVLLGFGPETMTPCGDAEGELLTDEASHCPAASQLGTATVDGPIFSGPLAGELFYRGESANGDYLGLLAASGYGVNVKLPFSLEEDAQTGAAIVAFPYLPQIPISELALHFAAATEALETVNECGTFGAHAEFQPWDQELSNRSANIDFTLTSGPAGTPCPGPATHVGLALAPAQIPLVSTATSTATARITDANGGPAAWDLVEFSSSDPGEKIGPVEEVEDGVYVATISSPTVAGNVTITAVDRSVEPNVAGAATLEQAPLWAGPERGPVRHPGKPRITRHPHRRTHARRPVFAFSAAAPRARFRCSVDSKPFRRCKSPVRLPRMRPGSHRFRVVTVTSKGKSQPASFRFTVLPPRRQKHRRR